MFEDDILTPSNFREIVIDEVHHGHSILIAEADFSDIRRAAHDALGDDDMIDRQLDSLLDGREFAEPDDYADAKLPSVIGNRAGLMMCRSKLKDRISMSRLVGERNDFTTCAYGHPWTCGAKRCRTCANLGDRRRRFLSRFHPPQPAPAPPSK